ncbi:MAG: FtsQ-type POTRA domain-containing protein [Phormidesmis sp.]
MPLSRYAAAPDGIAPTDTAPTDTANGSIDYAGVPTAGAQPQTGAQLAVAMPPKTTGPSAQALAQRRKQLKAKRKHKSYKMVWRSLAMSALAFGTVKLATSPIWLIRSASQIEVSDNQLLSDENIQSLLPVPYPQSLLSVQLNELENSLMAQTPIETAMISRRLVPPSLHVKVTERQPVAVSIPNAERPLQTIPDRPVPFEEPGLIDAEGNWMPRNSFTDLGAIAPPPSLQVIGMRPSDIAEWQNIYREIAQSPVTITAINWTRTDNLTLQSELGTVHLGPYGPHFAAQLTALDQLRQIGGKVNPEKVAFIDLQDPEHPVVEILQATSNPLE